MELTDEIILEQRAKNLAFFRVRPDDFKDTADPQEVEAITEHFNNSDIFAEPNEDDIGLCLCCGAQQLGFLTGRFTWGIVHGEGFCGNCGWPARLYHYIDTHQRITLLLQYHPNNLLTTKEAKVDEPQ